jgi:hypothetical protein
MTLLARSIALQGFALTPIAMAVQGLLGGDLITPPAQPRAAIVGRGPGTTINFGDYIEQIKRGNAMLPSPTPQPLPRKRRTVKSRQKMEEEILALAPFY